MRRILPLLLALTLPVSARAADTWMIDRNHSETSFQVRHMMSKVRGSFNEFSGAVVGDPKQPDQATVEFTIKTASIDTGVTNRDNHLKSPDFFDAEKFPEITFKSTRIARRAENQFDVTGSLTLHGVAKEVTLPVTFLGFQKDPRGTERAGFETAITLSRKDFGLLWNRTLDSGGFLLGDEVWVSINLEATKKVEAPPSPSPQAK